MFTVELDEFRRGRTNGNGWKRDIGVSVGELAKGIAVVKDLNNGIGVTSIAELFPATT